MIVPPLVLRAQRSALAQGLDWSCSDEDGALLHVLAARRGVLRVGEIGCGAGIGTAWLASALPPGTPLVSCDTDARLAGATTRLFADDPDVRVLEGDWLDALPAEAPFDLVILAGETGSAAVDGVLGLLAPGGTIVIVDAGPVESADRRWLDHPELVAVRVSTAAERWVVVAVRR